MRGQFRRQEVLQGFRRIAVLMDGNCFGLRMAPASSVLHIWIAVMIVLAWSGVLGASNWKPPYDKPATSQNSPLCYNFLSLYDTYIAIL